MKVFLAGICLLPYLCEVIIFQKNRHFPPQNDIFQLKCPVHILHQNHDLTADNLYD
jgi:hypothetical protein